MSTYFAADGSYGHDLGMFTFDTTAWPEWAWDAIDWERDDARRWMAQEINEFLTTGSVNRHGCLWLFWEYFDYTKLMAAAIRKDS